MKQIQLPFAVVLCYTSALVISIVAHILNISLLLRSTAKAVQETPQFPIPIRPATLTTVKTSRFGLFANDSDWDSILPAGDGFLYLPAHGEHYLVSHYHQLHCLRSMRHYFLKEPSTRTPGEKANIDHCLIHFRQMILCNVDLTLEPASHKQRTPDGKLTDAVTGVGVMHECKDWEQVRDYMETNYEQYAGTYPGRKT